MKKYNYVKVIQQFCATRWEDVEELEATSNGSVKDRKELKELLENYRLMRFPVRVIFRKQKI